MILIRRVLLCSLALCLSVVMSCTQEPLSIDSSDPSQVTRISQAPYRYQDATYWTLANGCTYSRGISGGGGWRWFLVGNPMASDRGMVIEGCAYVFDDPPRADR